MVNNAQFCSLQVLRMDPNNGLAKVHLGWILKITDLNYEEAIPYIKEGLNSEEPGVHDGRFYFHLGDALQRLGRNDEVS